MKRQLPQLSLLLAALLGFLQTSRAQDEGALTFTVGTTCTDAGKSYAYLLWQPGDMEGALGQHYAIYRKTGDFNSPALFARLGETQVQTSKTTIRSLLRLGAKVDAEAASQYGRIRAVYAAMLSSPEEMNLPEGANEELDAAEKLSFLMRGAANDQVTLERLFLLGRLHPGVMMALGHGFLIEMPGSGLQTFEIRELSGAQGSDVRLTGRVKLDASIPENLPAPGRPIAVPHPAPETHLVASPKDHLNVRLRWGIDDDLRLALPKTHGFNVYRIDRAIAEGAGFDVTPPTPTQIASMLGTETAVKVNGAPAMIQRLLTPLEAGSLVDPDLFFMHDDGEIRTPEETSFQDGDQFYYFVAARDIVGRIGELSLGTLVTICDRLPTRAPEIVAVVNEWPSDASQAEVADQEGEQFLRIRFKQLENLENDESAGRYAIYRWENHKQYIEQGGNPAINRIGWVEHDPNKSINFFDDNGAGAPTIATKANKTVWYTIRAEDTTGCAVKNLSQHSAPKPGVLRDRTAPDDPTGEVIICGYTPICQVSDSTDGVLPTALGLPAEFNGYRIEVERRSRRIVAFELIIREEKSDTNLPGVVVYQATHYFQQGLQKTVDLDIGRRSGFLAEVRVKDSRGRWSGGATQDLFDNEPDGTTGQMPVQIVKFLGFMREDCGPTTGLPFPVLHERLDTDLKINIITGFINLPPGTAEWRIYRRVGLDGELELADKKEGDSLPAIDEWSDPNPPAASGTIVCYYGQVFNAQGTPSELVRFGECLQIDSDNLATPMQVPAVEKEVLANGDLVATLKWFCDPVGVERFEILAAAVDTDDPNLGGDSLSPAVDTNLNFDLGGNSADKLFSIYQSPRLAGAFGANGAEFTLDVVVPADQELCFAIRAVGKGSYGNRQEGGISNLEGFRWVSPPEVPGPIIPWPARGLPGQLLMQRELANFAQGEGPLYAFELNETFEQAAGILIGLMPPSTKVSSSQSEGFQQVDLPRDVGIDEVLFKVRAQNGSEGVVPPESLLPFMVYRYQVPSTRYPNARPNLLQVSPLIDRIGKRTINEGASIFSRILDPFLGFQRWEQNAIAVPIKGFFDATKEPFTPAPADDQPAPGGSYVVGLPDNVIAPQVLPPYLTNSEGAIFWKDPMPVGSGARYRYLVVCFDEQGEIRTVIPTNPVQH